MMRPLDSRLVVVAVIAVALLLCLWAVSEVHAGKDFYAALGLKKGASVGAIKKAYRAIVKDNHPDKNPSPEAKSKFMAATEAYEVLSDAEKRQIYDQHGEEGLKQQQAGGGNPGDVFSQFFGGGNVRFNFGGQADNSEGRVPKGQDIVMEFPVTLTDLYLGREIEVLRSSNDKEEAPGKRQCNCKQKMVTRQQGYFIQQTLENVCEECPNVKFVPMDYTLHVEIVKGMQDGQELVFHGESDPVMDGDSGNLILKLKTIPHPLFTRTGNNLQMTRTISLVEALVGFTHQVKHLDGHMFTISRTAVTPPGYTMTIQNEGMPKTHDPFFRGHLEVTFVVDFPKSLTQAQKDEIKRLLA